MAAVGPFLRSGAVAGDGQDLDDPQWCGGAAPREGEAQGGVEDLMVLSDVGRIWEVWGERVRERERDEKVNEDLE